jgi:pilus assembly protein CpaF
MFSIIISEKGGAERRDSFDKTEINVGRVQGNDLMLPKGNVSKRHARLLYRDGRFIVTDLKSTNGTYVNGRKIAQATIVREGDKIYIGDFVLRIELGEGAGAGAGASAGPSSPTPSHDEPSGELAAPGRAGAPAAPPPLPGAPTAGPPPAANMQSPPIPQAPAAPRPDLGGPPPAILGINPSGAPPRETVLGPGPRAPMPPAMVPPSAPQPAPPPPAPPPPQPAPPPLAPAPPAHLQPPHAQQPPAQQPPALQAPAQHGAQQPPTLPPGAVHAPPPLATAAPPSPSSMAPTGAPPAFHAPEPPATGLAPPPQAVPPQAVPPQAVPPQVGPQSVASPDVPTPYGGAALTPPAHVAPTPPQPPAPIQPSPIVHASPAAPPVSTQQPAPPAKITAPPPASLPSSQPAPSLPHSQPSSPQPSGPPRSSVRSAAASEGVVDSSQAIAHRAALSKLMERATAGIDTAPLASGEAPPPQLVAALERSLAERAAQLRSSGELPAGLDAEVIIAECRRELFELGPIGPLLEDEYVEEVQVIRHDHIVAMHGKKQVATEIAFTSEAAVARVVRRICVQSGRPLGAEELFVERRLAQRARLFGVLPPASGDGHMLVLRKPQLASSTLEDLVKSGAIARQIATLLHLAVQGRANILVTGSLGAGATVLLGALAAAGSLEDRVVLLQEDDELVVNQPHSVSMLIGDTADEGARAVRAAIRVRPDRLVIGAFAGHVVPEIVDAIGDGTDGVLAAARAPTLRHLVSRLPADMSATRAMLTLDTAREWLASSFDLVLEVTRLRDGRDRVMRVAEFSHSPTNPLELRDIFTFTVERTAAGGTVEGSFQPTGVVPRIAEDLVSRGVPLDLGIFKRSSR